MKKLVILAVSAFLLVSCGAEVIPTGDYEGDPTGNARMSGPWPSFESEEEFVDFILEAQSGTMDEGDAFQYRDLDVGAVTHYYRLKNPPMEAIINSIRLATGPITIAYDTQKKDAKGEHMMMEYSRNPLNGSYNIEDEGLWARRSPPLGESHIFELEGLTYYIWKVSAGEYFLWTAEWANVDGHHTVAQFPYRFTPEEVLGYISDLERVEIG
jgi:hypothetical protein